MVRNAGNNRRGTGGRGNRRGSQVGAQNARSRLPNQIVLKPSYTAPYKFSRSFSLGDLPKGTSDQGYAYPFALNQIPSATEFTALFDKYRITMIDLTFSYSYLGTLVSSSYHTVEAYPALSLFMDDDDASIPTSKTDVQERMSVQRVSFSPLRQTISVKIRPRWTQSRAGTSTNLAPVGMWLDMATPGVQHYGVKLWADGYNSTSSSSPNIVVSGVMHFECNNVR